MTAPLDPVATARDAATALAFRLEAVAEFLREDGYSSSEDPVVVVRLAAEMIRALLRDRDALAAERDRLRDAYPRLLQEYSDALHKRDALAAERDRLAAEIAGIRSNCYYACVSKRDANAAMERVARDRDEVIEHWRSEAKRLEADRDALAARLAAAEGPLDRAVTLANTIAEMKPDPFPGYMDWCSYANALAAQVLLFAAALAPPAAGGDDERSDA